MLLDIKEFFYDFSSLSIKPHRKIFGKGFDVVILHRVDRLNLAKYVLGLFQLAVEVTFY